MPRNAPRTRPAQRWFALALLLGVGALGGCASDDVTVSGDPSDDVTSIVVVRPVYRDVVPSCLENDPAVEPGIRSADQPASRISYGLTAGAGADDVARLVDCLRSSLRSETIELHPN